MPAASLTDSSMAALGVAGAAAIGNWWSVSVGRRRIEWVTKPLVMVALIVAAICLDPVSDAARAWVVLGLVLSLSGDVCLMLPRERFIGGLASFLVAHLAYVVAFVLGATSWLGAVIGLVIAVAALATIGRVIVAAVRKSEPSLTAPVTGYMAVISSMVVAACATAEAVTIVGAVSFFASDGILAANKFVGRIPAGRFAVMGTYHVAQFCFVTALVR